MCAYMSFWQKTLTLIVVEKKEYFDSDHNSEKIIVYKILFERCNNIGFYENDHFDH